MGKPRLVSLLLVTILVAGCATHLKSTDRRPEGDDRLGASVANIWYVPGRAIVCGTTALISGAIMGLTLGHSYEDASQLMHGGCAGPWTVKARDIREAVADR